MADEEVLLEEALRRSVDEAHREDDELKEAIEESLKVQPSSDGEDPELARALAESREVFQSQQARLLAEYEKARNRDAIGGSEVCERLKPRAGEPKEDTDIPKAAAASVEGAELDKSNASVTLDEELAATLRASLLEPRLSVAEQQAAILQQYKWEAAWEKSLPESLHQQAAAEMGRPMTRAEQKQLSFDYGGNQDAADRCSRESTRWHGAASSSSNGVPSTVKKCPRESPKPLDTDPALSRRSTVTQSSIKKDADVDGNWLRGERRRRKVVLDGQNVACAHGGGRNKFSSKGLKIALDFFRDRNVDAIAIVPQHRADSRPHNRLVANNLSLLEQLRRENRVFFSPHGVHDDHFIVQYAMQQNESGGCLIVSNDKFREVCIGRPALVYFQ